MSEKVLVEYYSDVLCVWAWIAQRRIEELHEHWGDTLEWRHHYCNVFGDTATRIQRQWHDKGGYDGFRDHVVDAAGPFEQAPVNPDIWAEVRPTTSANAHLVIKAAGLANESEDTATLALDIRRAFFVDARDVSDMDVLLAIASTAGFSREQIEGAISDGSAMAALMDDYQSAQDANVRGSPSWIMNQGRQILYGNVGYKVLHANIEGILDHKEGEASWC